MNTQEIMDAYNLLAQNVRNQAAQDAGMIGNSQRSLGPLAARVASPSGQTSGLANYTYNRMMRPTVDSMAAALTTQGTGQALTKDLADKLRAAKSAYEDAQNNYTRSSAAAQYDTTKFTGYDEPNDDTLDYDNVEEEFKEAINNPANWPAAGTVQSIAKESPTQWTIWVADGFGKVRAYSYSGVSSKEEALQKYYANDYARASNR